MMAGIAEDGSIRLSKDEYLEGDGGGGEIIMMMGPQLLKLVGEFPELGLIVIRGNSTGGALMNIEVKGTTVHDALSHVKKV